MKWAAAVAIAAAVTVTGCGNVSAEGDNQPAGSGTVTTPAAATSITTDGVYEVGADITSGVWTAQRGTGCVGFTTSDGDFDLEKDGPGEFLSGSARVGTVQRIALHDGEFFTSFHCDAWQREKPGQSTSPDPATLAGACELLVGGDDLVQQIVAFLAQPKTTVASAAYELQDQLMAVVEARNPHLWNAAGQLVDVLDDPSAYVEANGHLDRSVTRAVTKIRDTCKTPVSAATE